MRIFLNKAIALFLVCVMLFSVSPMVYANDNASDELTDVSQEASSDEQAPDTPQEGISHTEDGISDENTIEPEIPEDPQAEPAAGIVAEDSPNQNPESNNSEDTIENYTGDESANDYENACINIYVASTNESNNKDLQITNASVFQDDSYQPTFDNGNAMALHYGEALELLKFHFYDPETEEVSETEWNKSIYGLLPEELLNQFELFHGQTDFGFELFSVQSDACEQQFAIICISPSDKQSVYYAVIQFAQHLNTEDLNRLFVEYNVENSEFVGLNADEVEALIMLRDDIRCSMEINAFGAFVSNEVRDINIEILPKITDIVEDILPNLPTNEQISAEAIAEELGNLVITTPFDENVVNEVFSADSVEELNNELPNNDDVLNTNATDNKNISPAVEGDDTSGELPPSDDEMALQLEEPQNDNEGIDDETPIPEEEAEGGSQTALGFLVDNIASASEQINGNAGNTIDENTQEHIDALKANADDETEDMDHHIIDQDDGFVDLSYGTTVVGESEETVPYYTVDFYYAKEVLNQETGEIEIIKTEHHIQGGSSILLSELFDILGIDKSVGEVTDVNFTNTSLVAIERIDGDYRIISLAPFQTEEVMSISLNNDEVISIDVEDEIASGTCGTCNWVITDAGELIISPTSGSSGTLDYWSSGQVPPWYWHADSILTARFVGTIHAQTLSNFFGTCEHLTSVNLTGLETSAVTNMRSFCLYCYDLTSIDLSMLDSTNITDMSRAFEHCVDLESINFTNFSPQKLTNLMGTFECCRQLRSLNLSSWNTSNVTTMYRTFRECWLLTTLNISGWNTSNVTEMSCMFEKCGARYIDLTSFNTFKVTRMDWMFEDCSAVENIDFSSFDTSHVTSMCYMLSNNYASVLDISNFDTRAVTDMRNFAYFALYDKLILGDNFRYHGNNITDVNLMPIFGTRTEEEYTRNWIKEDGTAGPVSIWDFRDNYDANVSTWKGAWIHEKVKYTVSYNANGGTSAPASQQKVCKEDMQITNSMPSRTDYVFAGWATTSTATSVEYYPGDTYSTDSAVEFFAVWQKANYTVTYHSGDGYFSGSRTVNTVHYSVNGTANMVKTAHTANIDDAGNKLEDYGANLATKDVVTIPYARSITVTITYGTQEYFDRVFIFAGVYDGTVERLMEAGQLYTLTGNMNTPVTETYTIPGDTVTIAFCSNDNYQYYGYYATVSGETASFGQSSGTYEVPTPNTAGYEFRQWNTAADGSGDMVNPAFLIDDATLYAIYRPVSIAEGTWWRITADGELIIGTGSDFTIPIAPADISGWPWHAYREQITGAHFIGTVHADFALSRIFQNCTNITSIDFTGLDASATQYFNDMFNGCSSLSSIIWSSFNTSSAINMSNMFNGCSSLTELNLSTFSTTNVTNMAYMFQQCSGLTSLSVSSFNTANVANMLYMFYGCSSLISLDLSSFNTNKVTSMLGLFKDCESLRTLNVSSFRTGALTSTQQMFYNCKSLEELSMPNFVAASVNNFANMFSGCLSMQSLDISGMNPHAATSMSSMFSSMPALEEVTLGTNFTFLGNNISSVSSQGILPDAYRWKRQDNTVSWMSAADLRDNYAANAATWAGVWVKETWWRVTDSGELIIGTGKDFTIPIAPSSALKWPWYDVKDTITSVSFIGRVNSSTSCTFMFYQQNNVAEIDCTNFYTDGATTMSQMFSALPSLTTLNIASLDTSAATNMSYFFNNCPSLRELTLGSGFVFKGTANTATTKALLPTPPAKFSTVKWIKDDSTAGPLSSTELRDQYDANVSTYAGTWIWQPWWELKANGELIIGTGATMTIPLGTTVQDGWGWNDNRSQIKSVRFIGTVSSNTQCAEMFSDCWNLETFDSTNFDTSKSSNLANMFNNCDKLSEITLSTTFSFNAANRITEAASKAILPTPVGEGLNGKWTKVDGIAGQLTPEDLRDQYYANRSTWSGVWVPALDRANIEIVFDAQSGHFSGNRTTNTVTYQTEAGVSMTKYSHTANIDDSGVASGGFDATQTIIDTVVIPGASSITVELSYSMNMSSDYLYIFSGTYNGPVYKNMPITSGMLYSLSKSGSNPNTASYTITGDTVTFAFYAGGVANPTSNYGYYAVVSGDGVSSSVTDGEYEEPTPSVSGMSWHSWNTMPDGTGSTVTPEKLTMSQRLYAIYSSDLASGPWWRITSDGELIIGTGSDFTIPITSASGASSWPWYEHSLDITSVSFIGTVHASSTCAYMFMNLSNVLSIDFSGFDTSNTLSFASMLYHCSSLTTIDFDGFDTSNATTLTAMFRQCSSLQTLNLSCFNTEKVTSMTSMFEECENLTAVNISSFRTPVLTTIGSMFSNCHSLASIDLSQFNTPALKNISYAFNGCYSIQSINVSNLNTSLVANMTYTFANCYALETLDISSFDTSAATSMSSMFKSMISLSSITLGENFDFHGKNISATSSQAVLPNYSKWIKADGTAGPLSAENLRDQYATNASSWKGTWITELWWRITAEGELIIGTGSEFTLPQLTASSNIPWLNAASFITSASFDGTVHANTDCAYLFSSMSKITSFDFDGFDTSSVENFTNMFANCTSLTSLDISDLSTASATKIDRIFMNCSNLQELNLSNMNTKQVTSMTYAMQGLSSLNRVVLGEDFAFRGNGLSAGAGMVLPSISDEAHTTKWVKEDGTVEAKTVTTLRDQYASNASTWKGAWVKELKTYTITYQANGGTGAPAQQSKQHGIDIALSSAQPSRENYSFLGWSTDSTAEEREYAPGDTFTENQNTVLYAVWGRIWWRITSSGELIIGTGEDFTIPITPSTAFDWPWYNSRNQITAVSFTGNVQCEDSCVGMFYNCTNMTEADLSGIDTSSCTMFDDMFSGCTSLVSIDLGDVDSRNATSMGGMFSGCSSLSEVSLGENFRFDGSNVRGAHDKAVLPSNVDTGLSSTWTKSDGSVGPLSSEDLRDQYSVNAGSWNGTWMRSAPHSITINHAIYGNQAAKDKYFKFNITISGLSSGDTVDVDWTNAAGALSPTVSASTIYTQSTIQNANSHDDDGSTSGYQWQADSSGVVSATIYLSNGHSVLISGVPEGSTYSVSEDMEGYKSNLINASAVNNTGLISDATLSFTSTRSGAVPAGVVLKNAGGIIFASVGIIGVGLILALKMRKKKDD